MLGLKTTFDSAWNYCRCNTASSLPVSLRDCSKTERCPDAQDLTRTSAGRHPAPSTMLVLTEGQTPGQFQSPLWTCSLQVTPYNSTLGRSLLLHAHKYPRPSQFTFVPLTQTRNAWSVRIHGWRKLPQKSAEKFECYWFIGKLSFLNKE